jgi:hypothetical protein
VVEILGEAPFAPGLALRSVVGSFGGEVFAVGSGNHFFDGLDFRDGMAVFFPAAAESLVITGRRELV